MFKPEDYKVGSSIESSSELNLGIKILIAGIELTRKEGRLVDDIAETLINGIYLMRAVNDPEGRKQAIRMIGDMVNCFPDQPVYIEQIPNEYCNRACCVNRPWLVVTTPLGRVKIGWRKRVISIDWSDSIIKKTAEELFPQESVTKEGCLIHAYGYENATRYLAVILAREKGATQPGMKLLDHLTDLKEPAELREPDEPRLP